jgi:hypothetical protein
MLKKERNLYVQNVYEKIVQLLESSRKPLHVLASCGL